jgi:hypothetical protein
VRRLTKIGVSNRKLKLKSQKEIGVRIYRNKKDQSEVKSEAKLNTFDTP